MGIGGNKLLLQTKTNLPDSIPYNDSLFMHSDSILNDTLAIKETVLPFFTSQNDSSISNHLSNIKISNIQHILPPIGDWFTIIVFILALYLIISRFLFSFNIWESIKGIGKIHSIDMVGFEKEANITGFVLAPIAAFVYAFYLYFFINPYYLHFKLDYLFFVFILVVILLFIGKMMIEKIISIIFDTQDTFRQYIADHLFILGLSGLFQAPLLIIYIYSGTEYYLWISIGVLIVLWLFRLFRGLIIGIKQTTFSKSFIILYLCSLEILPLLIVYKLAVG